MNKKIFIRTETSVSSSWADSLETLNTYYDGDSSVGVERPDVSKIKDYGQTLNTFVRIENRNRLFKNRKKDSSNFLSIGVPTPVENQTLFHSEINTDTIFSTLDKSVYKSVHFGYVFNKSKPATESEVVTDSIFFARNVETGKFEDVVTGLPISDKNAFDVNIWFTVYRIGETNLYYMITNTNMLTTYEDISGTKGDVDFVLLNTHDGTFKSSIFVPSFSDNTTQVGENILLAKGGSNIVIDTLGNSFLHGFGGKKLPQNELPSVKLEVESSTAFNIEGSQIFVDISKSPVSYIKYRWVTDTSLDYSIVGPESLTYSFVVMKQ